MENWKDYPGLVSSIPTSLWIACLRGGDDAQAEVKKLLDEGHAVDELDSQNRTALWVTCRHGDHKVAKILLDHGASIHIKSKESKTTMLLRSCGHSYGHDEIVKMLVARGADVNETDAQGWTPLMYACLSRNLQLVRFLISKGAKLDATITQGLIDTPHTAYDLCKLQMNPIDMAEKNKNKAIMKVLEKEMTAQQIPFVQAVIPPSIDLLEGIDIPPDLHKKTLAMIRAEEKRVEELGLDRSKLPTDCLGRLLPSAFPNK